MERPDGWKPILGDFVANEDWGIESLVSHPYWLSSAATKGLSEDPDPGPLFEAALDKYTECRNVVLDIVTNYIDSYESNSERPRYVVAPLYFAQDEAQMELAISQYLEAYREILELLQGGATPNLSVGEIFSLVHLDSVVFKDESSNENPIDLRICLLGPWHPLVVAKRFMVQYWIYRAASSNDTNSRRVRRLAALFEQIDGFRTVPGFEPDSLSPDISFAFPTSDPGWHIVVSSSAFPVLNSGQFGGLRGFSAQLRKSLGLRSTHYLAATDLWSTSFVRSYQRSHPSRRQLSIRVSSGLDSRPIVDSCSQLIQDPSTRDDRIAELLPGGIHLLMEGSLSNQEQLIWNKPTVFVYEEMEDELCYRNFYPDLHLRPQNEELRLTWIDEKAHEKLEIPRAHGRAAVFAAPLLEQTIDASGLPITLIHESRESNPTIETARSKKQDTGPYSVGDVFRNTLVSILDYKNQIRAQQPVLRQQLGLPATLLCEWTVLPGSHVDAGALATYITGSFDKDDEDRALWDYRLDIAQSIKSYFIVSKVPKSILSSLAAKTLNLTNSDASSALRELGEAGFAVGETMRSGKAAVGVLGLVGALRLARAAWPTGEANGWRWCTLLFPVDCMTDFLVSPTNTSENGRRTDLLAVHLVWRPNDEYSLKISYCAIECKYVSSIYPTSSVPAALSQAHATFDNLTSLFLVAKEEYGMHAQLAICQMLKFGMRLLSSRGDIGIEDEKLILNSTLNGSYEQIAPIASSILVTTSCGARGDGTVEVQPDGWWVKLTQDSWPSTTISPSDPLVRQLSNVFDKVIPGTENHESQDQDETRSPQSGDDQPKTSNDDGQETNHLAPNVKKTETHNIAESLIHAAFDGFVGNRNVIEKLSLHLKYAEDTDTNTIESIGLFGTKSTGKTELSRRIATALKIPYLQLSETSLQGVDQLAERIQAMSRENNLPMPIIGSEGDRPILSAPAMLVFIDEVHQLSQKTQDSLLPVLEADDQMLRGSKVTIEASNVSFVIATTDWGKLREAFRSRVASYVLETYTTDEVAKILQNRIDASVRNSTTIDPVYSEVKRIDHDSLIAISTAARAVPREALRLLREIGKARRVFSQALDVDSIWNYIQERVPCDRNGLTSDDRKYLQIVARSGPIGLSNIARELGADPINVESVIEPFLSQMGWLGRGPTGRYLTTDGKKLATDISTQG